MSLAIAVFAVVAALGILLSSPSLANPARDSFTIVMVAALAAAFLAYATVEHRQTGRLESITRQLGSRALVLLPVAIALDIALGAMSSGLGVPLHLDSVGTILVAVLCGPFAGALTGLLAAILGAAVVPAPFQVETASTFAVVGVLTGLLAGGFTGIGAFRPRPRRRARAVLIAIGVIAAVVAGLAAIGWWALEGVGPVPLSVLEGADGVLTGLGWVGAFVVVGGVLGGLARLLLLRDVTVASVVVSGALIGLAAGVVRALIGGSVLDGRTGSGMDALVGGLGGDGADAWSAVLGASLVVDPVDRILSCLAVYVVVAAIAVGSRARYPQAEWIVADDDDFALRVGSSMRATR